MIDPLKRTWSCFLPPSFMIDYSTNLLSLSNFLILDSLEGYVTVLQVDNVTTLHCRNPFALSAKGCWMRAFTLLFCIHMRSLQLQLLPKDQGKILRIAKIPKVDGFTLFAKKPWHNSRQWIGNDSLNTTSPTLILSWGHVDNLILWLANFWSEPHKT